MRFLITSALLGAVFVEVCPAQINPEHPMLVEVSSVRNTCLIASAEIPCGEVGSKLRALNVPLDADIHVKGDTGVTYSLVHSVFESLKKAGYSTKVGFVTR
jgi:biopolymer transport protein ExbD